MQIPAAEVPSDIEATRQRMGADPVVYLSVDVDNREGSQIVKMYALNLYDPEGNEYTFSRATPVVEEWLSHVGVLTDEDLSLQYDGLVLANTYRDDVAVSQRATLVMIGEKIPEQIADVQVYAEGAFTVSFAVPVKS